MLLQDIQRDIDNFFRPTFDGKVTRYPLTNLGVDKNEMLYIEVAVAGFSKEEIELELKGNQLYITGSKDKNDNDNGMRYIQRHISNSDFTRIMVLHENYVGGDIKADLKNGILTVTVRPKEPVKQVISIGN